jgi:predicted CopG family antitoxin
MSEAIELGERRPSRLQAAKRKQSCYAKYFCPFTTFFSIDIIQMLMYNNTLWRSFDMKMLNITISDIEYDKFGIKSEMLAFSDFIDIVNKELMRRNLNECIELADKYGLSSMSMEEITDEVNAMRNNA